MSKSKVCIRLIYWASSTTRKFAFYSDFFKFWTKGKIQRSKAGLASMNWIQDGCQFFMNTYTVFCYFISCGIKNPVAFFDSGGCCLIRLFWAVVFFPKTSAGIWLRNGSRMASSSSVGNPVAASSEFFKIGAGAGIRAKRKLFIFPFKVESVSQCVTNGGVRKDRAAGIVNKPFKSCGAFIGDFCFDNASVQYGWGGIGCLPEFGDVFLLQIEFSRKEGFQSDVWSR